MKYNSINKTVEAFQFGIDATPDWFQDSTPNYDPEGSQTFITNNGNLTVKPYDYVIKDGEHFYTVKPTVFRKLFNQPNKTKTSSKIRCLKDIALPNDSPCTYCCIYCKKECSARCINSITNETKEKILENCDDSLE